MIAFINESPLDEPIKVRKATYKPADAVIFKSKNENPDIQENWASSSYYASVLSVQENICFYVRDLLILSEISWVLSFSPWRVFVPNDLEEKSSLHVIVDNNHKKVSPSDLILYSSAVRWSNSDKVDNLILPINENLFCSLPFIVTLPNDIYRELSIYFNSKYNSNPYTF